MLVYLWRFLHLLSAFSFVGAITIAEWNGRQARATADWGRRAALWGVVRLTTRVLGFGALVLLGLLGNLLAVGLGLPLGGRWMGLANGLWLVGLLLYLFVALPTVGRLVTLSEKAATPDPPAGGPPQGYDAALGIWRMAYVLLGTFYVLMLALMVLRPLLS
jgi:uncharacterized membrane protein